MLFLLSESIVISQSHTFHSRINMTDSALFVPLEQTSTGLACSLLQENWFWLEVRQPFRMLLQGKYTKPAPLSPEDENKGIGKYQIIHYLFRREGVQKEAISEGVGSCSPRFFSRGSEWVINILNKSFSVEQGISYFTFNRCLKTSINVCINHFLSTVGKILFSRLTR